MKSFFQSLKRRIEVRRKYRRMIAEIASMTQDDLMDIGAFQIDLYAAARKEAFG